MDGIIRNVAIQERAIVRLAKLEEYILNIDLLGLTMKIGDELFSCDRMFLRGEARVMGRVW